MYESVWLFTTYFYLWLNLIPVSCMIKSISTVYHCTQDCKFVHNVTCIWVDHESVHPSKFFFHMTCPIGQTVIIYFLYFQWLLTQVTIYFMIVYTQYFQLHLHVHFYSSNCNTYLLDDFVLCTRIFSFRNNYVIQT